jgi:FdhD protein
MSKKKDTAVYYPQMSAAGLSPTHLVPAVNEKGELKKVEIAGELPLTIRVDQQEVVTLMTLGTYPEELALGYLRNQRLIKDLRTIKSVLVNWETESVDIKTVDGDTGHRLKDKLTHRTVTTGCGQGTVFSCTLDMLYETKLEPFDVYQSTLYRLLKQLLKFNAIYKNAGAVHACALGSKKGVEIFIEDVGRHNAADTIAGKMWLERISGQDKIFYTTGRLTSEIIMKAGLMEIPVILSRSGITHMALELAREIGIVMIARAKGNKFLVFNGEEHFIHDM